MCIDYGNNTTDQFTTLWIISPSFWPGEYFPLRIKRAVQNALESGFKVKFAKYAMNSDDYISDTPENRAKDLMEMFQDSEVDIVMSMIGGNHSNQILKYIDWEVIKRNPKPFVGFSDISVLHFALYTQTKNPIYYGPAFITQFWEYPEPLKYTIDSFKSVILNKEWEIHISPSSEWMEEFLDWWNESNILRPKKLIKNLGWKWLKKGRTEGKILWWCVPSINHCIGTKYWPDVSEKVFFIDIPEWHGEFVWLSIEDLDSYLADIDNIGVFASIKGLIIWRPYAYSTEDKKKLEELILYYTRSQDYPILLDFDIGHTDPIATIKLWSTCILDSTKDFVTLINT